MIDLPGKSKYGFILQTDLKSVEVKSKKVSLDQKSGCNYFLQSP